MNTDTRVREAGLDAADHAEVERRKKLMLDLKLGRTSRRIATELLDGTGMRARSEFTGEPTLAARVLAAAEEIFLAGELVQMAVIAERVGEYGRDGYRRVHQCIWRLQRKGRWPF